jgi:glycosyltransferase involved in cell wall biosynthesis
MRFSIVIPVRNGANYLESAIRSALSQARAPDEILVVDNGSEDETARIAQSPEWANRIRYVFHPENTGFVDSWNRAIANSTGDFVSILHHDDLLDHDYLGSVETALTKFPGARHAFTACRYINAAGEVTRRSCTTAPESAVPSLLSGQEYSRLYLRGVWENQHIHRCPGVTTSRALLIEQCTYRKAAGHIADDDFFYRVGAFTDVVRISQPMASYREHDTSTTSSLKLTDLVLARDYLFQIQHKVERNGYMTPADEVLFEKLAVRSLNEALYHTLRIHRPEWRDVLKLAEELELLSAGAMTDHLPVWARPMWSATRNDNFSRAFFNVSAIKIYRGLARRLRRRI